MKKMSLQWRLTIITTLLIAIICGCLTLLLYKNGIYYIDSLQDTVNSQIRMNYISILRTMSGMILQRNFP